MSTQMCMCTDGHFSTGLPPSWAQHADMDLDACTQSGASYIEIHAHNWMPITCACSNSQCIKCSDAHSRASMQLPNKCTPPFMQPATHPSGAPGKATSPKRMPCMCGTSLNRSTPLRSINAAEAWFVNRPIQGGMSHIACVGATWHTMLHVWFSTSDNYCQASTQHNIFKITLCCVEFSCGNYDA